jgi:ubiquinone/menaquinone biosynthesis C-methylase UbiE
MSDPKADSLRSLLQTRPATLEIIDAVMDVWPEHASYLLKSMEPRSIPMLEATEAASAASLKLMGGETARFVADYRWTCDQLRDEELFFHREGRYRLSTFAEAYAEVYSNHDYMGRYINGLLLTQVLWYNHIATFEMYLNRTLNRRTSPFDYLEIGPGHGLFTYFTAQNLFSRSLHAWDVSAVSLRETQQALEKLAVPKPIKLTEVDILSASPPQQNFDLIVISEVLEHLEDPSKALRFLRRVLSDNGQLFINIPLNSPSPDHIYLVSTPEDVAALVEGAGFKIECFELFATQARPIDRALASRISISAGVVAGPA